MKCCRLDGLIQQKTGDALNAELALGGDQTPGSFAEAEKG